MLPHVYCIFAEPSSDLVAQALEACSSVYKNLSTVQIIRFDEQFRQTTSVEWSINWKQIRLQPLLQQCWTEEQKIALLGFGSFHPNGYYRQQCVEALANYPNSALPFLFLRLNDWVAQVSRSAQAACEKVLQACTPEALISALPYLQKAQAGIRSRQFAGMMITPAIIGRLQQPGSKPCLEQALASRDLHVRRMCFQMAIEANLFSDEELPVFLTKERDPMTRFLIIKSLLQNKARENDEILLTRLLEDKSSIIRVFSLDKLYNLRGSVWDGLEKYLLDSSIRVREYVQFLYRKNTKISLATFYKQYLGTAEGIPAILGLGETGDISDVELLKTHINIPGSKQVQAVLRSIARLSGWAEGELYFQYLFDSRPGVAKRAFLCLRDTGCKPDGEQLYRALDGVQSLMTKKRLLQLIGNLSYWDSIYYLLLCVARDDIGELARKSLQIWRGTFLTPSKSQLERCRLALSNATPYLSARVYREYEFEFEHAQK